MLLQQRLVYRSLSYEAAYNNYTQMTENADALLKDPACQKSKDHFTSAVRVLELVQISEIEMLLETIIGVKIQTLSGKRWLRIHLSGPAWQGEGDACQ